MTHDQQNRTKISVKSFVHSGPPSSEREYVPALFLPFTVGSPSPPRPALPPSALLRDTPFSPTAGYLVLPYCKIPRSPLLPDAPFSPTAGKPVLPYCGIPPFSPTAGYPRSPLLRDTHSAPLPLLHYGQEVIISARQLPRSQRQAGT